jgi:SAM-dependent methyltransferase
MTRREDASKSGGFVVRIRRMVLILSAVGVLLFISLTQSSWQQWRPVPEEKPQPGGFQQAGAGGAHAIYFHHQGRSLHPARADIKSTVCYGDAAAALSPITATSLSFERVAGLIDAELLESFRQFHRRRAHPSQYTIEDKRQFLGFATQVYKDGAGHSGINAVLGARPYVIPKEIHAMSGEKMGFVAGGLYSADQILEALAASDLFSATEIRRGLDFGGSTGRATLAMQWAHPKAEWHLSDPIRKSVEWAGKNLQAVRSYASPVKPPMRYSDGMFDLVFAVSIWSHYNPGSAGMLWFDEMHRIVRRGGALVITTHGWPATVHRLIGYTSQDPIMNAMENDGYKFINVFPDNTDWDPDTKDDDWGSSFIDLAWLRRAVEPKWRMKVVLPGRSDCNQDVVVLERM